MTVSRFLAGVGALIWSPAEARYLLLKRSAEKDFAAGVWECVTGRVDQGEGFEDALHREVREELGVEIRIEFIIGTTHFHRGASHPENELVGVVYCCTLAGPGEMRISAEHSEHRWVTAAEAAALLTAGDSSTSWTWRVIARPPEELRRLSPEALLAHNRKAGFELG